MIFIPELDHHSLEERTGLTDLPSSPKHFNMSALETCPVEVHDVEMKTSHAERAEWVMNPPKPPGLCSGFTDLPSSPKHFNMSALETCPVEVHDVEMKTSHAERAEWVMNPPKPPGLCSELLNSLRDTILPHPNKLSFRSQNGKRSVASVLGEIFPILCCCHNYNLARFKKDLLAGLTLASLCIPQSIGYASLAKLDPQYGLYTSVVPPLIYAIMGTSGEISIGPVAVVSLLLASMTQKLQDPLADPLAYRKLILTATFFAGVFQSAFGLFRLGFLVDFLSHAAIVGFMAGAAIIIGLQQLKGLLGIAHFSSKTDVISVLEDVWESFRHPWNPYNFILGCAFFCFIQIARFLGTKYKKLLWLQALSPLLSVILSTIIVFLTSADKYGVKIVRHIPKGLNPVSVHQFELNSPYSGEIAKIGLISAIVALTEAIAVGRSFASIKGYHLDANKELVAAGFMNIAGSFTSCYVATGSFSRTAVNFSAGCETVVSNIVMAIAVLISLELFTQLLYFTPTAILASIILSALPGLINVHEAHRIWKVDKLDFFVCMGAFLGVLLVSVEIGLLTSVMISFLKIILISIQSGTETLGRINGTDMFCDINQYPMAVRTPGVLVIRPKSSFLCFANANSFREKILRWVTEAEESCSKGGPITTRNINQVVVDMSNLMNIDTSGVASLEELHKKLVSLGTELAFANPKWQVIHKLKVANKFGGIIFFTVGEAMDEHLRTKIATV